MICTIFPLKGEDMDQDEPDESDDAEDANPAKGTDMNRTACPFE